MNWLHNSSDPWNIVEKYWISTANTRLKKLMSKYGPTIAEYMEEFPALRKPAGYTLVSVENILNMFECFIIKIKLNFFRF